MDESDNSDIDLILSLISEDQVNHAIAVIDRYVLQSEQEFFSQPEEKYGVNYIRPTNFTIQ